jgi:6-phosphogluconolactonase
MKGRIHVTPTLDALARVAAERIVTWLKEEIVLRGKASLVLSGGGTPRAVYDLLGAPERRDRIQWSRVNVFWGDERCVGPTMPDSNFRMASEALLRRIAIPESNIHRIMGERHPQEAARLYDAEVRKVLATRPGQMPQFTLVLLGLGEDGHTASLFPGSTALQERSRITTEVYVDRLKASRVTLTVPALNNARRVLFLVSGATKAGIAKEVLEGDAPQYPAQLINPLSGNLYWLLDEGAASQLRIWKER